MGPPEPRPCVKIEWTWAHRKMLWQLIEADLNGLPDYMLLNCSIRDDLERVGYAIRNAKGQNFSTPKGAQALRDGLLAGN